MSEDTMEMRRCTVCQRQYPLTSEYFPKNGKDERGKPVRRSHCKFCTKYRRENGKYPPRYAMDREGHYHIGQLIPEGAIVDIFLPDDEFLVQLEAEKKRLMADYQKEYKKKHKDRSNAQVRLNKLLKKAIEEHGEEAVVKRINKITKGKCNE